jgi:NADH-quinone oxidoreductase subunit M
MVLVWLIAVLAIGAVVSWLVSRWSNLATRWVAMIALAIDSALAIIFWVQHGSQVGLGARGPWLDEFNAPWIPQFGISFHFAVDGLSLLLIMLTLFLGIIAVAASWAEIQERTGFFHFNLLWILAAIIGVFVALDLFLFYFFWEMMLIPMYFLIAIWGHERRIYASIKFFLFTQASGLFMLLAILGLYFVHGQNTGTFSFDYSQLLGTTMPPVVATWLMLGFFIAFVVKLPAVPFHTWLPDAHTEAPTAGSVILAGLMLKTGAYGFIRFVVPLFPEAALAFAPVAMVLAVAGILYGAMLAYAQTDLKRLVAYTSVSHMGFVLLGIFAWNELALQGAILEILAHGISTGALFVLVGALQDRIHTRDMREMGGLWTTVPRMGAVALVFALASLGLPGLGNFVAEFLVLLGAYTSNSLLTILATIGLIVATVYALWMVQAAFQGPNRRGWKIPDLSARELAIFAAMTIVIVWLGLFPQPVLNTAKQGLDNVQRLAAQSLGRPVGVEWQIPANDWKGVLEAAHERQ